MGKIARLILQRGSVCQPGTVSSGSGTIGGVSFRHWTRSAGPLHSLTGSGTHFGEHRINRYITDSDHNYFGYDLVFDSAERGAVYRLAFEPLSIKPHHCLPAHFGVELRTLEQLPLEQLPPPQDLRLGQAVEFTIATADGKHNVIERVEFSKPPGGRIKRLLPSLPRFLSGGTCCVPRR